MNKPNANVTAIPGHSYLNSFLCSYFLSSQRLARKCIQAPGEGLHCHVVQGGIVFKFKEWGTGRAQKSKTAEGAQQGNWQGG